MCQRCWQEIRDEGIAGYA
ncbi:zinc finger domain-containing protein [Thalassoroseus pseudoceratinae]